jgi:hypothetical protein
MEYPSKPICNLLFIFQDIKKIALDVGTNFNSGSEVFITKRRYRDFIFGTYVLIE